MDEVLKASNTKCNIYHYQNPNWSISILLYYHESQACAALHSCVISFFTFIQVLGAFKKDCANMSACKCAQYVFHMSNRLYSRP
jgi:hypothetical protein